MSLIQDSSSSDRVPEKSLLSLSLKKGIKNFNTPTKAPEVLEVNPVIQNNIENYNEKSNLTLFNETDELKETAHEIVVSTIDSSNIAFLVSLTGYLYFEFGFPLDTVVLSMLFLTFLLLLRSLNSFFCGQENRKKNLSDFLDLFMMMFCLVFFNFLSPFFKKC